MTQTPITPLRSWRLSRGLSIRDLERLTGINRGKLSIYERGVPVPVEDMRKITEVLRDGKEEAP